MSSSGSSGVAQPNLETQPNIDFKLKLEEIPFVMAPDLINLCNELSAKLTPVTGDEFHSSTSCSYSNSTFNVESKPQSGKLSHRAEENSTNSATQNKNDSNNERRKSNPNQGFQIKLTEIDNTNNESNIIEELKFRPKSAVFLSDGESIRTPNKLTENKAKYSRPDKDTNSNGLVQQAMKDQNIRVKILKLPENKLMNKRELSRVIPIFTIDTLTNSKIEIVSSVSSTKMMATVNNMNLQINKDGKKITQTVNISSTDIKSKNWNGIDQTEDEENETSNTSSEGENNNLGLTKGERGTFEQSERDQETNNSMNIEKSSKSNIDHSTEKEEEMNSPNEEQHKNSTKRSNDVTDQMNKLNLRSSHYEKNYYTTKQGVNIRKKKGSNDSEIIQHDATLPIQINRDQRMKHQARFPSMLSDLNLEKVEIIRVDPNYSSITKFSSVGSMQFTQRAVKGTTLNCHNMELNSKSLWQIQNPVFKILQFD
uniref:Uncharacterized protein n=1 Tax=Cacopsylla melanoneura TaxID=428564 RepID=A0A8D8X676_9HEMI